MANTIVKATPPTKTDHATLLFTLADKGVIQLTKRPANASFISRYFSGFSPAPYFIFFLEFSLYFLLFIPIAHIVFSLRKAKINILFVITDIMPDFILSPSSGS